MAFFEKNKDKIWSKYTLKRTKLHRFKKFSRGGMPPNPPSNEKFLGPPPPPKSWGRPCNTYALQHICMTTHMHDNNIYA